MIKPPKILFKYPSRGRKKQFLEGMDSIVRNLRDKKNYQILVSADVDDPEMRGINEAYPNSIIFYGESKSKIEAINRDIVFAEPDWDIIICMSDDMRFIFYGFDDLIRQEFEDGDFDKLVHIPDNDAKQFLATMYIAGRMYYERFGYIYYPEYKSLFADNEAQEVAMKLSKYKYLDIPGLIFHANPAYGHQPKDAMFIEQQEIGWTVDKETYERRKQINFGL